LSGMNKKTPKNTAYVLGFVQTPNPSNFKLFKLQTSNPSNKTGATVK